MKKSFILTFLFILGLGIISYAQPKKDFKFPELTLASFQPQSPVIDSNTQAVTLQDVGSSDFEGNSHGNFTLIYKRFTRILIKNRSAFDVATVSIPLYLGNYTSEEETIESFEATTYNVENGKIVTTKIDKNALLKEKYNKRFNILKFTFPNIKEGSIIEYKLVLKSPYYDYLRSWAFQNQYPCLLSEYSVLIPPVFNFLTVKQGSLSYTLDSASKLFRNYSLIIPGKDVYSSSDYLTISGDANFHVWSIKDVPAFKEESYTSSINNYLSKISFQLHSIRYSENNTVYFIKNWIEIAKELLENENFGKNITETGGWINDIVSKYNNLKDADKALQIFQYVRDNFTCNKHDALYLSQPHKKTFQTKAGNVADINLLLANLLVNQGFEVHPVILSTRDNGYASETTPILDQYNYVVVQLVFDSVKYYLDASQPRNGFGKLPKYCYNRTGRLIDQMPKLIDLSADNLSEVKNSMVLIINEEKGGMSGSVNNNLGYYESYSLRDKIIKNGKQQYLKDISASYSSEIKVENANIDSLHIYEEPMAVSYDFKIQPFEEDLVYFSPILSLSWKSNPFVSATRTYPVEMNYKINEVYNLNMEVPKGYKVDELPKSARVKLNGVDGLFEYLISNNGNQIQMRSKLILNKANFDPNDYETLRDFFAYVVKKHSEQIVFKKIK